MKNFAILFGACLVALSGCVIETSSGPGVGGAAGSAGTGGTAAGAAGTAGVGGTAGAAGSMGGTAGAAGSMMMCGDTGATCATDADCCGNHCDTATTMCACNHCGNFLNDQGELCAGTSQDLFLALLGCKCAVQCADACKAWCGDMNTVPDETCLKCGVDNSMLDAACEMDASNCNNDIN